MKLRVVKRAQRQIARMQEWWTHNRPAAPTLLMDELETTFQQIRDPPRAGVAWRTRRRPTLPEATDAKPSTFIWMRRRRPSLCWARGPAGYDTEPLSAEPTNTPLSRARQQSAGARLPEERDWSVVPSSDQHERRALRRRGRRLDGYQIPYIGKQALIKNKKSAGRHKDLADVEELERIE